MEQKKTELPKGEIAVFETCVKRMMRLDAEQLSEISDLIDSFEKCLIRRTYTWINFPPNSSGLNGMRVIASDEASARRQAIAELKKNDDVDYALVDYVFQSRPNVE